MFAKTLCEELGRLIEVNEKAGATPVKAAFAAGLKCCGREECGSGRTCEKYPKADGCECQGRQAEEPDLT